MAAESGAVYFIDSRDYGFDESVAADWLREHGYDPGPVLVQPEKGAAKRACLEIWLDQVGSKPKKSDTIEELEEEAQRVFTEDGAVPPLFGKTTLCDGRTGEPLRPARDRGLHLHAQTHPPG